MSKKKLSLLFSIFIGLVILLGHPAGVSAHPLGNFSVNRYSRLDIHNDHIDLLYIVDMAEIPTFQEKTKMDINGDETISQTEQDRYLVAQLITIQDNLQLSLDDTPLALTLIDHTLVFSPGQGDLETMRLSIRFTAPFSNATTGYYQDNTFADRLGWQEIIVRPGADIAIQTASVPANDISNELQDYPEDLLSSPPDVSEATFTFGEAKGGFFVGAVDEGLPAGTTDPNRFSEDKFAELIHIPEGPLPFIAALLLAFVLGALHALSPGHGKTIVGAYLVGSRGTAKHALFLGLTTTITHTAGVFLFGLIVLFASRFILPEQLYPWLGVLSGLLVVSIGFSLLRGRINQLRQPPSDDPTAPGYHVHFGGQGHSHLPNENVTWHNLLALGVSGGLLPCPSALVLLLSAVALQKVGLGLLLIVIFSLGLASVLTGIGVAMVYAGKLFNRLPSSGSRSRWLRAMPALSALFITIAGAGITIQALLETGVL